MDNSRSYLHLAADCLKVASKTKDSETREDMIRLADLWERLAAQAQKKRNRTRSCLSSGHSGAFFFSLPARPPAVSNLAGEYRLLRPDFSPAVGAVPRCGRFEAHVSPPLIWHWRSAVFNPGCMMMSRFSP
jgi:hypothetical protein